MTEDLEQKRKLSKGILQYVVLGREATINVQWGLRSKNTRPGQNRVVSSLIYSTKQPSLSPVPELQKSLTVGLNVSINSIKLEFLFHGIY